MSLALGIAAGPLSLHAADVDRGEQLARQWCASCHLLPGATQSQAQGAPIFRDLARAKTAEALKLFLVQPHGAMPPLSLSRAEIDALVGYIESLR
jgi:mono/diheme cytochrome c family protein